MSNTERYRHGPRTLVQMPVASLTVIEKGDLICLSGGNAVPPSVLLAQGSEQATAAGAQSAVADAFIGVAENASASGDTDDILVDVSLEAIFEFDQETAAGISFGDRITAFASSTASASFTCADQSIVIDASPTNPIAVCVKAHSTAVGTGTLCKLIPQAAMNDVTGQP